jgi:hypothetical protein
MCKIKKKRKRLTAVFCDSRQVVALQRQLKHRKMDILIMHKRKMLRVKLVIKTTGVSLNVLILQMPLAPKE